MQHGFALRMAAELAPKVEASYCRPHRRRWLRSCKQRRPKEAAGRLRAAVRARQAALPSLALHPEGGG